MCATHCQSCPNMQHNIASLLQTRRTRLFSRVPNPSCTSLCCQLNTSCPFAICRFMRAACTLHQTVWRNLFSASTRGPVPFPILVEEGKHFFFCIRACEREVVFCVTGTCHAHLLHVRIGGMLSVAVRHMAVESAAGRPPCAKEHRQPAGGRTLACVQCTPQNHVCKATGGRSWFQACCPTQPLPHVKGSTTEGCRRPKLFGFRSPAWSAGSQAPVNCWPPAIPFMKDQGTTDVTHCIFQKAETSWMRWWKMPCVPIMNVFFPQSDSKGVS